MIVEPTRSMEARQRRMELRRNAASIKPVRIEVEAVESEDSEYCDESSASSVSSTIQEKTTKKRKSPDEGDEKTDSSTTLDLSLIRGIKKQARYQPTIPISSKAELAAWRKEARRIRNRESAAASRNKTRQRIEELEQDLSQVQKLYDAALGRIAQLEAQSILRNQDTSETQTPSSSAVSSDKDLAIWTSAHQHAAEVLASSLWNEDSNVPSNVVPQGETEDRPSTTTDRPSTSALVTFPSHQNIMISRPTADCVVSIQPSLLDAPTH
jgi:Basic region leucine zipper